MVLVLVLLTVWVMVRLLVVLQLVPLMDLSSYGFIQGPVTHTISGSVMEDYTVSHDEGENNKTNRNNTT